MSTLNYDDVPKKRLGEALHAARTMIGLQEQEAADALGISVRKLRHWEEGRKAPDAAMAAAIGKAYGLDLGGNLPPRVPIVFDTEIGGIVIADRVVPYVPGLTDNDDFLEGYVRVVRELRGVDPDTPIQLRSSDIQVLATVLDLTDDDLEDRLAFWMGQPAGSMVGVRHRLVLAAVVVGVVGGATAGAFMADTSVAAEPAADGPEISQTLDDDLDPDAGNDVDLGTASVELAGATIEMELDDDEGGLVLDFGAIEGDGFQGLDLEVDLSELDDPEPTESEPTESDTEPSGATDSNQQDDGDDGEQPQAAPQPPAEPAPVDAELDSEPTSPSDSDGEALLSLGDAIAADAASDGELAGSPTVDDWVADGFIDESEESMVDMLDLVEDDGDVEPPIPGDDEVDVEVAGPETEEPEPEPDEAGDAEEPESDEPTEDDDPPAEAPQGENWDFDGTREWVRQNLDGGWVDGWQGDGVALTGTDLWEASSGDTSVDLNGDGPGWFGRTVDTVEGQTYEITFDLSGNPHGQRGVKSLNLTAGGDVGSFDFDTTDISRNDMQWETVTMTFTADADSTWVSFDSTTPGSVGAVIDNITITPVSG